MKKLLLLPLMLSAAATVGASGPDYGTSNRPEASERLFTSQAVERQIERIRQTVTVPKLAWMFENVSTKFSTKADSFFSFISAFFIEKQHDFCLFMFHVKQFVCKIVHKI